MDGLQSGIQQVYPGVAGAYTPQLTPQTLGGSPLSGLFNSGISGLFGPQMQRQPQLPFTVDPVAQAILQQAQFAQQLQFQPYQTGINRLLPLGADPITTLCIQQAQLAQLVQQLVHQVQAQQFQQPFGQQPFGQQQFGANPWAQSSWLGGQGIHGGRGFMGIPGY